MLHEFMVSFHTCMRAEAPAIAHLHLVMQEQNSKQTAVSQKRLLAMNRPQSQEKQQIET